MYKVMQNVKQTIVEDL